ncbi:putative isomerase YbhE [Lipomyces arxii]|uniref:putative isomerase YbhE n=1 Tax=Lipomyces arxii TaxID=56418 RepID=UPI0034CE354B
MARKLLLSGERADFTVVDFDEGSKKLSIVANYPSPENASWVETTSTEGSVNRFIGLSGGLSVGSLYTFEIDHANDTCKITSQQPTLGAPAHFITLGDKSALVLGTFCGGSIALYPITVTDSAGLLLMDTPRIEIFPKFAYEANGHGPNEGRQHQCHVHQILEGKNGLLYAPDLGSDRVWIVRRDGTNLEICGEIQVPPGTGPRHAVFTSDEKIMYVLGEMSHEVTAYDMSGKSTDLIRPMEGFSVNIIPSSVHADHQFMMDSAELSLHPTIPNVLYVSNRWEKHIAEREPRLTNVPEKLPSGDTVAVVLLSSDGKSVEGISHVRTSLDTIRGMRLSDDGKYMAALGQEGGGIEVYEISGERGEVWTLISSLSEDLESGIKHAVWL